MARKLYTRIGLVAVLGFMVCVAGAFAFFWPVGDTDTLLSGLTRMFSLSPDSGGETPSNRESDSASADRVALAPATTAPGKAPATTEPVGGTAGSLALAALPDKRTAVTLQPPAEHAAPGATRKLPLPGGTDGQKMAARAEDLESKAQLVEARQVYTLAIMAGLPPARQAAIQTRLLTLAEKTLLGPEVFDGDPLAYHYTIKPGDSLGRIARQYQVTAEFLARINHMKDPDRIRAGQRIKVVQGPFRAEIVKRTHALYVYLQDTLVKQFPVGLGENDSTPSGQWTVKNKLPNPTYYAPDGSGDVKLPDDPENPLGEHWLGLHGVAGEAVGQEAYGVHGTIEPETIGKDASMGCVRMHNADVEQVFDMLIEKQSTVEIFD